jgi:hypothetical protein
MNRISRTLSGIGALALGLLMTWAAVNSAGDFLALLWVGGWAALLIGIAVYLFLNDQEDVIEEIKSEEK